MGVSSLRFFFPVLSQLGVSEELVESAQGSSSCLLIKCLGLLRFSVKPLGP